MHSTSVYVYRITLFPWCLSFYHKKTITLFTCWTCTSYLYTDSWNATTRKCKQEIKRKITVQETFYVFSSNFPFCRQCHIVRLSPSRSLSLCSGCMSDRWRWKRTNFLPRCVFNIRWVLFMHSHFLPRFILHKCTRRKINSLLRLKRLHRFA